MPLFRLRVRPLSPWCTPWQADTLFGLLCWTCARTRGADEVRRLLVEPALNGHPPFVLSDACPGEFLPAPVWLRAECRPWNAKHRKQVNKARWVQAEQFRVAQTGALPTVESVSRHGGIVEQFELHNLLGRTSSSTADSELYPMSGYRLSEKMTLSIFLRADSTGAELFLDLMRELSTFGFGAEASTGKGEFSIEWPMENADWLDQVDSPNGLIVLSTFQPGYNDPTDGAWETFLKYGKLGPDFGVENVFKRPLILLRPGASFRCESQPGSVGRAIPMSELFSKEICQELTTLNASVIHAAFGLTVPCIWPN